jgi:hypothetical protein
VSIREHTCLWRRRYPESSARESCCGFAAAYVSIRQAAYVSIRQAEHTQLDLRHRHADDMLTYADVCCRQSIRNSICGIRMLVANVARSSHVADLYTYAAAYDTYATSTAAYVCYQHTYATNATSIRSACESRCGFATPNVRPHASAYVSIREHT